MADSTKDTIYIDVDDEITGIIDSVNTSKHKIVALVLPKRAAMLQSIVNMKLLKRAGAEAKKNIVLITSEAGLLPLAGAVGLHVAKTPLSKPYVPAPPETPDSSEAIIQEDQEELVPAIDNSRPVGDLAGLPPVIDDEAIEVDNTSAAPAPALTDAKKGKKKFNIPNFERFRLRLILGIVALVVLVIGWLLAAVILPKARVIVKTDTTEINSEITFTADAATEKLNVAEKLLPAELKKLEKTEAEKVPATGEKDVGTKATGTVTFINCTDEAVTIPAGTAISGKNLNFITKSGIDLDEGEFTSSAECKSKGDHIGNTGVTAEKNGDQYNLGARSYDISGVAGDVRAQGSDMSGGTSKIIKVVTEQDVASAQAKINERAGSAAAEEVQRSLKDGDKLPLPETLTASQPAITASPTVGQEAAEVTVTAITTYTMLGVNKSDLQKLIGEAVKKEIDPEKQTIQNDGLDKASFNKVAQPAAETAQLTMKVVTIAGPELDIDALKQEIAGKKRGEVEAALKARPGIKSVDVSYSPFWVLSTPKRTSNITIVVEKSDESAQQP